MSPALRQPVLAALLLAAAMLCLAATALADPPEGRVAAVSGGTVVLEDGRSARLAGILPPPPGWPHAEAAEAALRRLLAGRTVTLARQAPADRHGRVHAHLHLEDGTWVQGALLGSGMARVHTTPDARDLAAEMLEIERDARHRRAGLWRYDAYRVRPADAAGEDGPAPGTYQLVEGRVAAASRRGRRVYLNFGPDWRKDFTAAIPTSTLRAFRDAGLDPLDLGGRRIRVRGWVHWLNGPAIELTHPEQIEILPDPEPRTMSRP